MILKFKVPACRQGVKISQVLRGDMGLSAAIVRRLKLAGGIYVDGESVFTNFILSAGQEIEVDIMSAEPPCGIVPESGRVDILYEDGGLLALNKPAGIITHPSRAQYLGSLSNYAAGYLENTRGDGRCHCVNRLDRGTSGAVLFAKNSFMAQKCAAALKMPDSHKHYTALAYGRPQEDSGVIRLPIYRPDSRDIMRTVHEDGQNAVTHYKVLRTFSVLGETVSLLFFRLDTGRTHQIRVHCKAAGFPLLGDKMYCTESSSALSEKLGIFSQALHCRSLSFTHPISGSRIVIDAPILRDDMTSVMLAAGIDF